MWNHGLNQRAARVLARLYEVATDVDSCGDPTCSVCGIPEWADIEPDWRSRGRSIEREASRAPVARRSLRQRLGGWLRRGRPGDA